MNKIVVIALNAFKESVRDRVLYNIVFLGLILVLSSTILGDWSVFDKSQVISYFSLGVMSISGLMMAIFVGISLVTKEIRQKTVLTLLSKPVSRAQFLLGKYFGLLLVLVIHLTLMALLFFMLLWLNDAEITWGLAGAVLLVFFELSIVVSIAILFSTFSSPILSALFTLGFYVSGHLSGDVIRQMNNMQWANGESLTEFHWNTFLVKSIHYLLPDLEKFNISSQVVSGMNVPISTYLIQGLYAGAYAAVFMSIAIWWFSRKDFP